MKFESFQLPGVKLIEPDIHHDSRGYFFESYRYDKFFEEELSMNFIQDNEVYSSKDVLRGLHYQLNNPQGKYVSVIKGKIFDVCVDLRKNSKTFGKYFSVVISEKNSKSIFVPPGFAHGFLGMKKENIVVYGCDNYRHKNSEAGIMWNDPKLKIKWPTKKPILSKKDKQNKNFNFYFNKDE